MVIVLVLHCEMHVYVCMDLNCITGLELFADDFFSSNFMIL